MCLMSSWNVNYRQDTFYDSKFFAISKSKTRKSKIVMGTGSYDRNWVVFSKVVRYFWSDSWGWWVPLKNFGHFPKVPQTWHSVRTKSTDPPPGLTEWWRAGFIGPANRQDGSKGPKSPVVLGLSPRRNTGPELSIQLFVIHGAWLEDMIKN